MFPIAPEMDKPLYEQIMQYYMTLRKTRLEEVDAIERLLNISPRTAELRKLSRGVIESGEKKEGE